MSVCHNLYHDDIGFDTMTTNWQCIGTLSVLRNIRDHQLSLSVASLLSIKTCYKHGKSRAVWYRSDKWYFRHDLFSSQSLPNASRIAPPCWMLLRSAHVQKLHWIRWFIPLKYTNQSNQQPKYEISTSFGIECCSIYSPGNKWQSLEIIAVSAQGE